MAGIEQGQSCPVKAYDHIAATIEHMSHARRCRIDTIPEHDIPLVHQHTAKGLAALLQFG